jgi:hypothetical protein
VTTRVAPLERSSLASAATRDRVAAVSTSPSSERTTTTSLIARPLATSSGKPMDRICSACFVSVCLVISASPSNARNIATRTTEVRMTTSQRPTTTQGRWLLARASLSVMPATLASAGR